MNAQMETMLHVKKKIQMCLKAKQTNRWQTKSPSVLTADDTVVIQLEGMEYELDGGDSLFIRSHIPVVIRSLSNQQVTIFAVSFEHYMLTNDADDELIYKINYDTLPDNGQVVMGSPVLFHHIKRLSDPSYSESSQVKLLKLVLQIFQQQNEKTTHADHYSIQMILQYIAEHYQQELTRKDLAHKMGFNESYFSTFFKKSVGMSVTDYIAQIRMDEAKKLLFKTDEQVQAIAQRVGYTDSLYFSRKFRQKTGRSPSQYRLSRQPKRIAAFQFVGSLLALGVKPICMEEDIALYSDLLQGQLSDVFVIHEHTPDDVLKDMNLDLILMPDYFYTNIEWMKRMEKFAPVLVFPYSRLSPVEEVLCLGSLIGRSTEAKQWVERYEKQAQKERARLTPFLKKKETVALYEVRGHDKVYMWSFHARGAINLYKTLGLKPPEAIQEEVLKPDKHVVIPLERLADYAADHMFFIVAVRNGWYRHMDKRMMESDVLRNLPAVQNDTFYLLKLEEFRFGEGERAIEIMKRFSQFLIKE
ncbi:helix-turn-helix domain-containing protein [Bacillus pumilus]|uniref:helix-turn-helix domain-containing protein n=1 Tax=Bacillus pumilus TaxID=1408 RepID=UPI003D092509